MKFRRTIHFILIALIGAIIIAFGSLLTECNVNNPTIDGELKGDWNGQGRLITPSTLWTLELWIDHQQAPAHNQNYITGNGHLYGAYDYSASFTIKEGVYNNKSFHFTLETLVNGVSQLFTYTGDYEDGKLKGVVRDFVQYTMPITCERGNIDYQFD